jgi:hypothetical protein
MSVGFDRHELAMKSVSSERGRTCSVFEIPLTTVNQIHEALSSFGPERQLGG